MSLFDAILPIDALNGAVNGVGNIVRGALGLGATKSNSNAPAKFTVNDFKGEVLGKGLAEENRFEVFIGIPPCLSGSSPWGKSMQGSIIRVESVTFPALTLHVKQRKIFGASESMPTGMDYGGEQGLAITFLIDRDMMTKKMFDAWIGSIVDTTTQTVAYPDQYRTMVGVHQLDRTDGSVYEAVIQDAYPKHVSSLQGTANSGNFHRLQVIFAYRKWYCNEVQLASEAANSASIFNKTLGNPIQSVSNQISQKVQSTVAAASSTGSDVLDSLANFMPGTSFAYNPYS
jgi:hypothetical protein